MSSGYRPPSTEPQGRWARHIHAVRKERGWSQTRGFERARENGLPLGERSRSAYIAIDMGERLPTPAEEPSLIATYGLPEAAEPEQKEPATPEGMAGLVSLVTELIGELRAERQARVEWEQGFLEAMRELARAGEPLDDPAAAPLGDVQSVGR